MSFSSLRARLVMDAMRLENSSASSSRAFARAVWTRQASSAVRFSGATSRMTPPSAAAASPAKSAILDSATPSSHRSVSPSESTQRNRATCSRNSDQDARPAGALRRLKSLLAPGPAASRSPSSRTRSGRDIRTTMPSKIAVLISRRMRDAISSRVE